MNRSENSVILKISNRTLDLNGKLAIMHSNFQFKLRVQTRRIAYGTFFNDAGSVTKTGLYFFK